MEQQNNLKQYNLHRDSMFAKYASFILILILSLNSGIIIINEYVYPLNLKLAICCINLIIVIVTIYAIISDENKIKKEYGVE